MRLLKISFGLINKTRHKQPLNAQILLRHYGLQYCGAQQNELIPHF
jgi:hypothetical protein